MGGYSTAQRIEPSMCQAVLGCGVPMHGHTIQATMDSVWLPSTTPTIPGTNTSIEVVGREVKGTTTNLTLSVAGPSRIVLLLSSLPSARIVAWSLSPSLDTGLQWGGAPAHYVQLVQGLGQHTHTLWVLVEGEGLVASVAGHYNHGQGMVSPVLRTFMDSHPPWVSW